MDKQEFYDVVETLIVPLFTGSFLAGEMESSSRDLEVALGRGNTVLLKPTKLDDYRLILKRGQAFKSFEVNLIRAIIREFDEISNMEISDKMYLSQLNSIAIEKALIESITDNATDTILGIINGLEQWSTRTYEGNTVQLGILVNLVAPTQASEQQNQVTFKDIINANFFALFSDGNNSFIEFDRGGNLLGHVNIRKAKAVPTISPRPFERIARVCNDKRVGIVLTVKGDILVFFARQLIFAKRNGKWGVYSHEEIIKLLQNNANANYTAKEIRKALYNTALDCSFAYKGACIVYVNKDKTLDALNHIDAADIISEEHFNMKKQMELDEAEKLYNIGNAKEIIERFSLTYDQFLEKFDCIKTIALRKIVAGKKLQELDRKLIEEMTSVDGATIIDFDGTIISVGAIIKIEAGSVGGGRLAATSTMAKYGTAIKVSQDGIMTGFSVDKRGDVKQIFNV